MTITEKATPPETPEQPTRPCPQCGTILAAWLPRGISLQCPQCSTIIRPHGIDPNIVKPLMGWSPERLARYILAMIEQLGGQHGRIPRVHLPWRDLLKNERAALIDMAANVIETLREDGERLARDEKKEIVAYLNRHGCCVLNDKNCNLVVVLPDHLADAVRADRALSEGG